MSRRTRAAAVVFALLMVAAPAAGAIDPAGRLGAPAGPTDRGATAGAVTAPSVADGTTNATNATNSTEADADATRTATADGSGTDDAARKLSAALRGDRGATADRSVAAASVDDPAPVTVVVLTDPGAAESVAAAVRALDGTVELVHGDAVQATLPRAALGALAERSDVSYVRKPRRPEPTVVSEGVGSINATALHDRGVTGENVTVAVVDVGGFNLSNPELDGVVAHRNYHEGGIGNGTVGAHGTATAALVSDAAPGANVVAVRVGTYLQAQAAVEWLREETDVDAVSMSLGWKDVGPLDGTAPLSTEIQRSVDAGTPYFVAAGNAGGGNHWDGQWSDPDGDGWLNFAGDDELMTVETVSPGSSMLFALQWDDWPDSDQDYALYLYQYESDFDDGDPDGGMAYEVVDTAQTGSQEPLERFEMSGAYGRYYVAVRSQDADNSSYFTAFAGDAQRLTPSTSARSVTEPGVAPAATTVGAVDAATGELEPFSSRGPTVDGRRKPDLVGPDNVSTGAYGGSSFYGTSAAAPHTAGAAALLLGVDPDLSPAEVETTLTETASPVGGSEPNSNAGAGLVDAGAAVASVGGGDTGSGAVDARPEAGAPANASAGSVTVGGSTTLNVTVENDGNAPLSVTDTEIAGPNASAFTVTNAPATVAPGGNGTVTVEFAPTSVGSQRATLSVAHNASGSPLTVGLSGTGVGTASVRVPATRAFGNVSVGETATRNVSVENTGTAPLSVAEVGVAGADAEAFTVTNAPDTVAPARTGP
ncbi:choice-of-anchor D domain-containing protein [Candidatus Halobonum tyrrellensis]|uniref:Peptidase S8/S53 subtilisin kexin sedolisin n=1 Tax=Candidatus Halobonum tyrrellensis G22 TaxID=1324957 RepID=V4HDW8_9EURY|nr:choice-of-anchor D domain-containing protein [Candidatus Halobonum tyrrellensis]ESP88850.1 peptidase S8/S53 subtilisin kexin sedolisin [Candidatus Halobonum tyrrellensis G22]